MMPVKAIAYSSPFVPAEWIAAHGFRPHWLRLRAAEGRPLPAVARGVCPYVAALMDAALAGLDAAALVLTTVCDQMRYAAALLEMRGSCPTFLLNVPSTWQTAAAAKLYLDELRRLGRFFVELGGKAPQNAELSRIMFEYDRTRNADSVRWGDSCTVAPGGGSATATPTVATGIPLAVLGGPLWDTDGTFFDLIGHSGGRVVLDATEGAQRTMPRRFDPARAASDPLRELADAYFEGIPDAFRRPNSRLYEWLGRELAARRVEGIILRRYLWCDLWHAELQRLRQWSPVPVLEIDVGPDDTSTPAECKGELKRSWRCSSESRTDFLIRPVFGNGLGNPSYNNCDDRHTPTHHLGRVGPAVRRTARGRTPRARLRRTAGPARRPGRSAIAEAADRQFGRPRCGCGTFCSRKKIACAAAWPKARKLVGTMKDLGTVPVMAYSLSNLVAFYPDGAWWLPCLLEGGDGLLEIADSLGIDDSFCPVRAMLGAFVGGDRFPIPGLLTCSVGATCDDFSAIAQRLESLGFPILWWEMPHRRRPDPDEAAVELPGGFSAPAGQVAFVQSELDRVRQALEAYAGQPLER